MHRWLFYCSIYYTDLITDWIYLADFLFNSDSFIYSAVKDQYNNKTLSNLFARKWIIIVYQIYIILLINLLMDKILRKVF